MCPRPPLPRLAGVRKVVALVVLSVFATTFAGSISASALLAQESGGSFGGGAWDEPSGGSGGGGGGGGGSDWGSSGGTSGHDFAEEARRAEERRVQDEERRRQEEERRRLEEERRQEEERLRQEAEARRLAERARKLALPPAQRAQELSWPSTPPRPAPDTSRDLSRPMSEADRPSSSWASPEPAPIFNPPPATTVRGPVTSASSFCCGVPLALLLVPLAWLLTQRRSVHVPDGPAPQRSFFAPAPASKPALALRVSAAFDWNARPELQRALANMAKRHDLRSRPGLHAAALEVSALLARHASSARYVTWELATGDARSWFTNRTNDLRARFKSELVRNQATQQSSAYTAKAHEGEGLVVVTVLVASKVRIPEPPSQFSAATLAAVIQSIAARNAGETLALEVVWSPAAENDRMSSYELESHYPELQKISDGVGRMQCGYCRAPFPKELGRCPACGAPVG